MNDPSIHPARSPRALAEPVTLIWTACLAAWALHGTGNNLINSLGKGVLRREIRE